MSAFSQYRFIVVLNLFLGEASIKLFNAKSPIDVSAGQSGLDDFPNVGPTVLG
jgi:hypothetical protein